MTRSEWLALAAIAVALVVGVGTIVATRRWGNRRRRLLFAFEVTPLLPPGRASGVLEVTYHGFPVEDPHLLTVRIRNMGPLDVATKHFDGGSSFVIWMNCKMYGIARTSHPAGMIASAIGAEGKVEFVPQLLRRGDEWAFEAIVEGTPDPEFESPLIDTDVVEGPSVLEQATKLVAAAVLELPFGLTISLRR